MKWFLKVLSCILFAYGSAVAFTLVGGLVVNTQTFLGFVNTAGLFVVWVFIVTNYAMFIENKYGWD